jgi:hypothetical protein
MRCTVIPSPNSERNLFSYLQCNTGFGIEISLFVLNDRERSEVTMCGILSFRNIPFLLNLIKLIVRYCIPVILATFSITFSTGN